jgi:hypothetical protein
MKTDGNGDDSVTELTGNEGGVWQDFTVSSVHVFDLDAMTVTRIPGSSSVPTVNDRTRPIRSIDWCRVGERGEWTMHEDGRSRDVDYYWHVSSTISRISRQAPTADQGPGSGFGA